MTAAHAEERSRTEAYPSSRPLEGVRVVELGRGMALEYCGRLLAEMGAEVIAWRDPEQPASEMTAVQEAYVSSGKRTVDSSGLAAALDGDDGAADIVLEPRSLDPELPRPTARTVRVTVSPFGATGPYRDYAGTELTLSAFAGLPRTVGRPDDAPLLPAGRLTTLQAGIAAALGAVSALFERRRGGEDGQTVDVAIFQPMATWHTAGLYTFFQFGGAADRRQGRRRLAPYPFSTFDCKDGQVTVITLTGREWRNMVEAMGNPDWAFEERYRDRRRMGSEIFDEVDALVAPWMLEHTKQELFEIAKRFRIPMAPMRTVPEVVSDPHLRERGFFAAGDGVESAEVRLPFVVEGGGEARGAKATAPTSQEDPPGPLAGLRVLDCGRVFAGPLVGVHFADLGAEVIKIESRSRLDASRMGRPILPDQLEGADAGRYPDLMAIFHNANRGKSSAALNLAADGGREALLKLVETSDVLVENFRAGTLEKFGLDYESLAERNPRLVLVRISGTGQSGPDRDSLAYAQHATGMAGVDGLTGYPGEQPLGMVGANFGDACAALYASLAAMGALIRAEETGRGCEIDVSMVEAAARQLGPEYLDFAASGRVPEIVGNDDPALFLQGIFACAGGDDEWIAISVRDAAEWERAAAVLALDTAAEADRAALHEAVATAARGRDKSELFHALQARGVPASPVFSMEEQVFDAHYRERGVVQSVAHPVLGEEWVFGFPFQLDRTPLRIRKAAPDLGADTDRVLAGAGYDPETIERLREEGAVE